MAQTFTPTFGDLLKHSRKRAGMTQGDLAAALGYSVSFVSALEQNRRLPDVDAVLQVFVPALSLQNEPQLAIRLVELAASARGQRLPVAITRQREMQIVVTEARSEPSTHLPVAPTDLIGRAQEVRQLCQRLPGHTGRLLTLVGPPGIGKTSLALAVAAQLHYHYRDGTVFVPLAAVSDAVVMAATIATSVGSSDASPKPPKTKLIEYLRRKTMLLVLDNLEQIRDAAHLIADLLAACPGLCVLATSRERLHLRAEQRFQVPPLDLAPAIELFVQRAQAVNADFRLTPQNQPTVAAICQRLDCLPLALELCAAQIDLLSPAQLLAHLHDRRLDLLVEGAHDLPPRQRTLRTAIQHSYQLLDDEERTLFRRLGVFVGGFDLPAVAAVAADSMATAARPLNATLHTLIGKSLVRAETTPAGDPRFTMLETIREYARERLEVSGEAEAIRRRHADYYLALAERAEPLLHGAEQQAWLERLAAEHDNLRATLAWSQATPNRYIIGLRLTSALGWFWFARGYLTEGRAWLVAALARSEGTPPPERATALNQAGRLASFQADHAAARALFEEALSLSQSSGDRRNMARAFVGIARCASAQEDVQRAGTLFEASLALAREAGQPWDVTNALVGIGVTAVLQGDYERGETWLGECLALCREQGDRGIIAVTLTYLGYAARNQRDYTRARLLYEESLALSRQLGDVYQIADAFQRLGNLAWSQGDYPRAAAYYDEGLALLREIGDQCGIAASFCDMGYLAHDQGDDARAAALLAEGLTLSREIDEKGLIAYCLRGLGGVSVAQGEFERGARLLSAAEALFEAYGQVMNPTARDEHDREVAAARAQLGQAAFEAAWHAGRGMPLEQAIAYALEEQAGLTHV